MLITEHTTVTYLRTWEEAEAIAAANRAEAEAGETYEVHYHAGRRAYLVEVKLHGEHVLYL